VHDAFVRIFGEGEHLDALQMGARAFVTFFCALVLIRVAGMRSFGKKSAFDIANGIMLGAVLSRGIVGASPWGATIVAGLVLVLLDRTLAMMVQRSRRLERLVKGESVVVFAHARPDTAAMRRVGVTDRDLMEAVRKRIATGSLDAVDRIVIESSGELTVVEADERPRGTANA
jgi:uncharacterized membrane protein YcaP (DUF421 family)